jgi:putative drug exporter of the RND superfamily
VNVEGESRADPEARTRAPIRLVPRMFAWLIVFLRWPIILAWIAAAVYVTVELPGISESATDQVGGIAPEHSESLRAEQASLEKFSFPLSSRTMLIQREPAGLGRGQAAIARKDLRISQDHVPPFPGIQGALPVPNGIPLLPFDERGTAVLSYLFPATFLSADESTALAERLAATRRATGPAPQVGVTGSIPAQVEQANVISDNLIWLDIATVVLVFVIVGLHFRAPLPPLISVAGVAIAFLVSTHVVAWIAERVGLAVSNEVTPVMTVLLFGVLTDYSIFLMARFRTLLEEEGIERVHVAARRCTGELLPVIVTAGLVIALATGSLYLADLGFLHALGPGMALTVLVAMLVGATFVPAVLAVAGRATLWPRRLRAHGRMTARPKGVGARAVRLAVRYPVTIAALCLAALLAGASGLLEIRTANPQITNLPADSYVNRGYRETSTAFGPGMVAPTTVVVERPGINHDRAALAELQRRLAQQPDVAGVIGPADNPLQEPFGVVLSTGGDAARFLVVLKTDPFAAAAINAVRSMRSRMPDLLTATGLTGAQSLIGGDSALSADTASATQSDLRRVAPIALAVILLMLVLLLRALIAPLYLLIASVLAVLAALGVTTYVFQDLLGNSGISLFVPLTIAVLLLSLGSDYNIFLVARIWQEARVRPLREAIDVAGGRSTRAITVAGLVLAGSFGAAALIPLDSFRELAFGMAAGLLIDTFLVRTLFVPALISAFGPISGWPGKRPGTAPGDRGRDEPFAPSEAGEEGGEARYSETR